VFSSNRPRDIVITYDGATLLTAVAHEGRVFRTDFTPGSAIALALAPNIESNDFPMFEVFFLLAWFVPMGLSSAILRCTNHRRYLFASLYVIATAISLELTAVLVSGGAFEWHGVGVAAAVGGLVSGIVSLVTYVPDPHHPSEA
jgi:MFS family permease